MLYIYIIRFTKILWYDEIYRIKIEKLRLKFPYSHLISGKWLDPPALLTSGAFLIFRVKVICNSMQ